jgi:predicted permease
MNFTISAIIPQLISLALFGIIYALVVYKWGEALDRFTWLLVVIGVGVTIGSLHHVIGTDNTLYLLFAFIATGAPMIFMCVLKSIELDRKYKNDQKKLLHRLATGGIVSASEDYDAETESVG